MITHVVPDAPADPEAAALDLIASFLAEVVDPRQPDDPEVVTLSYPRLEYQGVRTSLRRLAFGAQR